MTLRCAIVLVLAATTPAVAAEYVEIPADVLEDKIRGGLLGQLLGNLNGLQHEMNYVGEPGEVEDYTPGLPDGARTDDDTDIEWVYLVEMERSGEAFIPAERITQLWKSHINRKIWCANHYTRSLMDIGIDPPFTGTTTLNPWADFNISGQFICESFGLIAPAMPQTASRVGLHYAHVTISGEPAQTTQLFTTMIATAFVEDDIEHILDAGMTAVDPKSEIHDIVRQVRRWCAAHPDDWRKTRKLIHDRYTRYHGEMRDRNGYELNTASTIAALHYGRGDLVETLRIAFNFGWDADNNAATSATIVGVILGRKWMDQQGWNIKDAYENTTRDKMPDDETITRFGDRLIHVAEKLIVDAGGEVRSTSDGNVFRILREPTVNIEPLSSASTELDMVRKRFMPGIEEELGGDAVDRARAAYIAICLSESGRRSREHPKTWLAALDALRERTLLIRQMLGSPGALGYSFKIRSESAGLGRPPG